MFSYFSKKSKDGASHKATFITMLIFGVAGLLASFVLAVEEFHLIKNPDAVLTCSINLILNCAEVMKTWQATVFGFPNMFIGLMGYPIVITVAVAGLAGVAFPRWFLITANICYGLGALFAYWLFFNSVYVIEILCPWCLIVTFVTTIIFASITHYNLRNNVFNFSNKTHKAVRRFIDGGYDKLVTATWIALLAALVFLKFGSDLFA